MDCSETLMEKLAKQARTLESHVVRLNVKVEQICPDGDLRQEFGLIKTELRNLTGAIEEAQERSTAVAAHL